MAKYSSPVVTREREREGEREGERGAGSPKKTTISAQCKSKSHWSFSQGPKVSSANSENSSETALMRLRFGAHVIMLVLPCSGSHVTIVT